jgi:predicted enzyme related to lactoylglutathione lyase
MGERTSYTPGTFSWADLGTSDPDGAKRFYGGLFGWEFDDQPLPGDGGVYTLLRRDGQDVAALYQAQEGQPTAWGAYVTVEAADASAARAVEQGGTLAMEPFDVLDAGRMAAIPGSDRSVLQRLGAAREHRRLTRERPRRDHPHAAEHERSRHGARVLRGAVRVAHRGGRGGRTALLGIYVGDRLNAGMMQLPPDPGPPPHWLVYFGSENVDDDAGRVGDLGGQVMVPPTPVPGGRILVAQDPQGAVFGLFAGRFDD